MIRLLNSFFLAAFFGARAAEPEKRLLGAMHAAEFEVEVLQASDITLTQAADTLRLNWGATEAALTLGFGTLAIDYAPVAFDLFGSARGRKETALSAQLALRHRAGPRLELLAGLGARDGHDSYRALWLDKYFRQRFSGRPGYRFPERFAWWCPFCQAAASQVRPGIVDHYNSRGGNPAGLPVLHVSLNLESGQEADTQRFINSYGLGQILNDSNRAVAHRF